MRANARLGRIAVAGAVVAAPFGYVFLKLGGAAGPSTSRPRCTRSRRC